MRRPFVTRRQALMTSGAVLAGASLSHGQQLTGEPPISPYAELADALEFERMAQRKLDGARFAEIAGSDRKAFDRITLRPRMMVPTVDLDLTTSLFGRQLFAPIMVGPIADQKRFHPEGELAMARGCSAAQTAMVATSRSSFSIEQIAAETKAPLWYQVYLDQDIDVLRGKIQQAVNAGCQALIVTIGAPEAGGTSIGLDWTAIDRLRQGLRLPVLIKGIMSPQAGKAAVDHGAQGIIVSQPGFQATTGLAATIDVLSPVLDAVAGKAPVLVDGSFRRGTDILKALAMGAQAVLLGRPPVWALSTYGAEGVQRLLELLQSELARYMAMCGKINLAALDRSVIRMHPR